MFPFQQHRLRFLHQRRLALGGVFIHALRHQLPDLSFVLYVKTHVVVADEVVTFLAAGLRCLALPELEPGEHRLADMNAAVVHDIGLDHLPAVGLLYLSDGIAQEVVAHVPEVQGFVGVGRRVLDHHQAVVGGPCSVGGVCMDSSQLRDPPGVGDAQVQEALHGIVLGDELLRVCHQPFAYFRGYHLRGFAGSLHKGEDHYCHVALKLGTSLLQLYLFLIRLNAVQRLHRRTDIVA